MKNIERKEGQDKIILRQTDIKRLISSIKKYALEGEAGEIPQVRQTLAGELEMPQEMICSRVKKKALKKT